MIHPIPPGTRDVLPDEMRELRAIAERLRATLRGRRLRRGLDARARVRGRAARAATSTPPAPRYRTVRRAGPGAGAALGHDDPDRAPRGHPLRRGRARRCASATSPTPTARSSAAPASRASSSRAGIELIGVPGPEGEAEVVALTLEALDAAGLRRHRIGVGDGALYRALLDALEVPAGARTAAARAASRGATWSGSSCASTALGLAARRARPAGRGCPSCAAGREVLERGDGPAARRASSGLRALLRAARGSAAWPTG